MKRLFALLLCMTILLCALPLTPACAAGSQVSTADVYKWSQNDGRWSEIYSAYSWNKACAEVAIAIQIARTHLVTVDESAETFDINTGNGFNPASFAKAAVKYAGKSTSASVGDWNFSKIVPGFKLYKGGDKEIDDVYPKYSTYGKKFRYFPADTKEAVAECMQYYLDHGYYPIIEGEGTNGSTHYVAVISTRDTNGDGRPDDVIVINPNGGKRQSLYEVSSRKGEWSLKILNAHATTRAGRWGCCTLYYESKPRIAYDPNAGIGAIEMTSCRRGSETTISWSIPQRDGYAFLGWSTQKNASAAEYYQGQTIQLYRSLTLYAVWGEASAVTPESGEQGQDPGSSAASAASELYAAQYLALCRIEDCDTSLRTEKDTLFWTLPCSDKTSESSQQMAVIPAGTELRADQKILNTADHDWYRVSYGGRSGYVYSGNVKPGTASYMSRCASYPSLATLYVTSDNTYLKSCPCSQETFEGSETIRKCVRGESFQASAVYRNTAGNCWYQVSDNGTVCYIYGGDVSAALSCGLLSISGVRAPSGTMKNGARLTLKGEICSDGLPLAYVYAGVYSSDGKEMTCGRKDFTKDFTPADSYPAVYTFSIRGSEVDKNCKIGSVPAGKYTYKIVAAQINFYTPDGKLLVSEEYENLLYSDDYKVK